MKFFLPHNYRNEDINFANYLSKNKLTRVYHLVSKSHPKWQPTRRDSKLWKSMLATAEKTLEIHVSSIQEGRAKMFAELHRLSESLNSRGESWQESPSQNRINNHSPPGIEGKL